MDYNCGGNVEDSLFCVKKRFLKLFEREEGVNGWKKARGGVHPHPHLLLHCNKCSLAVLI
jgi:hypothetical protein